MMEVSRYVPVVHVCVCECMYVCVWERERMQVPYDSQLYLYQLAKN